MFSVRFFKCQKNLAQNISEIHFWPEKKRQYSVFMLQILYRINSLFSKNTILSLFILVRNEFRNVLSKAFWHLEKRSWKRGWMGQKGYMARESTGSDGVLGKNGAHGKGGYRVRWCFREKWGYMARGGTGSDGVLGKNGGTWQGGVQGPMVF